MILDTIKKAEDSDALILRLYESRGTRGRARLTSPLPIKQAALVNLLEDELAELDWVEGVYLNFKPFEILSVRLEFETDKTQKLLNFKQLAGGTTNE